MFPVPDECRLDVEPTGTQKLIEALLSRSATMKADIDQIPAALSMLDPSVLSQYFPSDRVKAILLAKADRFPLGLLLRHLQQVPSKPREEWRRPNLQSRASFYNSGRTSTHIATLCERGVPIRSRGKVFWRQDMHDPTIFNLIQDVGTTFWLKKDREMFSAVLATVTQLFKLDSFELIV